MNVWIVQVGEPIPELDGPIREFRCAMLTKAALEAGHNVTRWSSTFRHSTKTFRAAKDNLIQPEPLLMIRLLHGCGYSHNRSVRRLHHHKLEARAFQEQSVRLPKPDLIFCGLPTLHLVEASIQYGAAASTPVVVDVRDLWPDHYLTILPPRTRFLFRYLLAWEFRKTARLLRAATALTAISQRFLGWALALAEREQTGLDGVYPIGYSLPAPSSKRGEVTNYETQLSARFGLRAGDFLVCFLGSFVSSFDFKTVIRAARVLGPRYEGRVKFLFVGGGEREEGVRRLARGLQNVHFCGWVGDPEYLRVLLRMSHVGLAPYRTGGTVSLPNKPFEYMAEALPLLSSLEGELAAILRTERVGLTYQSDDPESLITALSWMVEHPTERLEMAKRAKAVFDRDFQSHVIYPSLVKRLERIRECSRSPNSM